MSGVPVTFKFPVTANRSPEVEIEISGVLGNLKKIIAVVDTGFEGFLQIPLADGIATNLNLWAIQPFFLADGSQSQSLVCFGEVRFLGKKILGEIVLTPSGGSLIGIQLLKQLSMDMTLSACGSQLIFSEIPAKTSELTPEPATASTQSEINPTVADQSTSQA